MEKREGGGGRGPSTLEKRSFTVVDATVIRERHSPSLLFHLLPLALFASSRPVVVAALSRVALETEPGRARPGPDDG